MFANMLRTYDKLEDVPEALRSEYKLSGGKYVPDLSDDHPVLVNNRTLLSEKQTSEAKAADLQTKVTTLESDLSSANAGKLPRGTRAVPVADVEALEAFKALGTVDEVKTKITEHETLKKESSERAQEAKLREVAKDLGYSGDTFVRLPGLPDFEKRKGTDGKDSWIAKVKDSSGTITEKPAREFIESSPDVAPFLPALKVSGVRLPEQRREAGAPPANMFDKVRESVKEAEKNAIPPSAVEQRFGIAKPA